MYAAVANWCAVASVLITMLSFPSFDDMYLERSALTHWWMDSAEETEGEANANWRSLVSSQQLIDV
jgi:hypothetical protein